MKVKFEPNADGDKSFIQQEFVNPNVSLFGTQRRIWTPTARNLSACSRSQQSETMSPSKTLRPLHNRLLGLMPACSSHWAGTKNCPPYPRLQKFTVETSYSAEYMNLQSPLICPETLYNPGLAQNNMLIKAEQDSDSENIANNCPVSPSRVWMDESRPTKQQPVHFPTKVPLKTELHPWEPPPACQVPKHPPYNWQRSIVMNQSNTSTSGKGVNQREATLLRPQKAICVGAVEGVQGTDCCHPLDSGSVVEEGGLYGQVQRMKNPRFIPRIKPEPCESTPLPGGNGQNGIQARFSAS